jgi:hypothetical protein
MPRIISNVPDILPISLKSAGSDIIGWYCERGKEVRITDMRKFVKHTAPKQTL